jgi:5-hydroxyisourate hydrolase
MATERAPITCHVLDTTTGRPAANIIVKLYNPNVSSVIFTAPTNADGRIANWENFQGPPDGGIPTQGFFVSEQGGVNSTISYMIREYASKEGNLVAGCPLGSSIWKLEFDTGNYYGVQNTFFPRVELTFLVKEGEHFHVPLLLGPYSFTTYRGS